MFWGRFSSEVSRLSRSGVSVRTPKGWHGVVLCELLAEFSASIQAKKDRMLIVFAH